jgi:hypothetical protein
MVNKGNHPQMALIQVSEILQFTQIYWGDYYGKCWEKPSETISSLISWWSVYDDNYKSPSNSFPPGDGTSSKIENGLEGFVIYMIYIYIIYLVLEYSLIRHFFELTPKD